MTEEALAKLIQETVQATSAQEPDYTILATIIIVVVCALLGVIKFLGIKNEKSKEKSANRREGLLTEISTKQTTHTEELAKHTTTLAEHVILINQNKEQISALWTEKEPKK